MCWRHERDQKDDMTQAKEGTRRVLLTDLTYIFVNPGTSRLYVTVKGLMNFSHHPNIAGYPLHGGNQSQLPSPPYLYTPMVLVPLGPGI
jgi:hypothetical protein